MTARDVQICMLLFKNQMILTRVGVTKRDCHSKRVARCSIPLQKATSLGIILKYVFFHHVKMHSAIHSSISYLEGRNSLHKESLRHTRHLPLKCSISLNQLRLLKNIHVFLQMKLNFLKNKLDAYKNMLQMWHKYCHIALCILILESVYTIS